MLEIRLLGQLQISSAHSLTNLKLTHACQRLFAYLLLNTGKPCRREVLMDVFWRDSSPERARSSLNSALSRLRRELEIGGARAADYLLTTDGGEICFNWAADYWLDLQLFEEEVAPMLAKPTSELEAEEAAQLERTLTLYRGELLEGIYDDWALSERERLRLMYLNALTRLMNYCVRCGALDKSVVFAGSILKEDPLREDVHRTLMRLHLANGQRALAVQQYRKCVAVLERELGVPPMEETQQLYLQIIDSATAQWPLVTVARSAHPDIEQHLDAAVRNLGQAQTLLEEAAHILARAVRCNAAR